MQFHDACKVYSAAVSGLYLAEARRRGYGYKAVAVAPQTYGALRLHALVSRWTLCPFPVWKGVSDRTVFTSPDINHMFRYLHDHEHVDQRLTLSVEDERKLGEAWSVRIHQLTGSAHAGMLAHIDTVGQTDYYAQHAAFPEDQREWAMRKYQGM